MRSQCIDQRYTVEPSPDSQYIVDCIDDDGGMNSHICQNHESLDQIIWAIQVLSDKFGNELKQIILSFLDSKTSSFCKISAYEKSETDLKFELYKIENIALDQREMIIQQREEIGKLKVQMSDTQKSSENEKEQILRKYRKKIEEYKVIVNRLTLYCYDKNKISKLFNFMKTQTFNTKKRKLQRESERLRIKVIQKQQENENLVSKEVEAEKDITHILNTQIKGFKEKTFNCLIEKSIIKNKDTILHKEQDDKAVDAQIIPKWNLSPFKSTYFSKNTSSVAVGYSRTITKTRTNSTVKLRTRSSQTLSPTDIMCIKPMNLQRRLLR